MEVNSSLKLIDMSVHWSIFCQVTLFYEHHCYCVCERQIIFFYLTPGAALGLKSVKPCLSFLASWKHVRNTSTIPATTLLETSTFGNPTPHRREKKILSQAIIRNMATLSPEFTGWKIRAKWNLIGLVTYFPLTVCSTLGMIEVVWQADCYCKEKTGEAFTRVEK